MSSTLVQPLTPSSSTKPASGGQRLDSLDILRGFTVLLMIFVDEIGEAYPALNHSPWDSVTLADFVMPWFLFMVGASLSISLRKYRAARTNGSRVAFVRALKLFFLGVLVQGGGFPDSYSYGFNLSTIRWCGILNRIGFAYLMAALIELWVPERDMSVAGGTMATWPYGASGTYPRRWPHAQVFSTQVWKWLAAASFVALHLMLTFFTPVPSWTSYYGFNASLTPPGPALLSPQHAFTVHCDGVRGHIETPECSAEGYYDRLLFGQDHLGVWMSRRLPECSSCAPGAPSDFYRPRACHWQPNATDSSGGGANWCFAHMYDPEGALSTVPTVGSVWLGAHFGRVLRADGLAGRHRAILAHWALFAACLIGGGLALHFTCLPMNKQLWSTSYLLFMAGTCGAALALTYAMVDAKAGVDDEDGNGGGGGGGGGEAMHGMLYDGGIIASQPPREAARGGRGAAARRLQAAVRRLLYPLKAMGMNAILFFFWHGPAEILINAVYVDPPTPGPADPAVLARPRASSALLGVHGWVHEGLLHMALPGSTPQTRQLAFVLLKLIVYLAVAVACHRRRYFWKI